MGNSWCFSNQSDLDYIIKRRSIKSGDIRVTRAETALFVQILKFDLNLEKKPHLTIEDRFTRENTNDLGEFLLPQTAHIIITEFKKFMYLQAWEIQSRRRKGTLGINYIESSNDKWYFKAPLWPPPYLDRVWKLLILYNKNYEEFCETIWGGFIDRENPRENPEESFRKYKDWLRLLEKKKDMLKPFQNLWPEYNKQDQIGSEEMNEVNEFISEHNFTWYVSGRSELFSAESSPIQKTNINQIITFIRNRWDRLKNEELKVQECINLAEEWKKEFSQKGELEEAKINIAQNYVIDNGIYKIRPQKPKEIFDLLFNTELPKSFINNLMAEHLIDFNIASKWILEYKKYLALSYFTDEMVSPSEKVDQVWHLHMTYTEHYRKTCQQILGKPFKHTPSLGGNNEGDKYKKIYEATLDLYRAIFMGNQIKKLFIVFLFALEYNFFCLSL